MTRPSFLSRDFLLLAQGQFVNQTGTQIALVATAFWLKQSTNSAGLLGLMTAVSALPLLLLGPLGGACADRWSRRNILIACDLIAGVIACAMALLLRTHSKHLIYLTAGFFAGNLILASCVAFTLPAMSALTPDLVPEGQVGKAMAFSQGTGLLTMILGQSLGGILLTRLVPATLFAVDAATYFFSAIAESFVRADKALPRPAEHAQKSFTADIKEGFRYVWERRGLRALLLATIPLNVLSTPVIVLLPFYTTNALHQPLTRFGYLLAALSMGMLAGYALGGRFPPAARYRHAVVFSCVVGCAAAILSLALFPVFGAAAASLAVLGCLIGIVTLVALTVLIEKTEPEKRGRVSAVLLMVTQGLTPLSMALIGLVSDLLGNNLRLLDGGCGVILCLAALAMAANRDLRDFLQTA